MARLMMTMRVESLKDCRIFSDLKRRERTGNKVRLIDAHRLKYPSIVPLHAALFGWINWCWVGLCLDPRRYGWFLREDPPPLD